MVALVVSSIGSMLNATYVTLACFTRHRAWDVLLSTGCTTLTYHYIQSIIPLQVNTSKIHEAYLVKLGVSLRSQRHVAHAPRDVPEANVYELRLK